MKVGESRNLNQACGKRRKRRLGRRLNHLRPRDCGGQEVRSRCCGRGCLVGDDRQIIDYDAVVAPTGRHRFAGANEPLGRVSRTADSSLKEASLAGASEFKVPSNLP